MKAFPAVPPKLDAAANIGDGAGCGASPGFGIAKGVNPVVGVISDAVGVVGAVSDTVGAVGGGGGGVKTGAGAGGGAAEGGFGDIPVGTPVENTEGAVRAVGSAGGVGAAEGDAVIPAEGVEKVVNGVVDNALPLWSFPNNFINTELSSVSPNVSLDFCNLGTVF